MIGLLYRSRQIVLCCITNNPKISIYGSKIDLFLNHDICSFLVIRRVLFILITQEIRLMEKSPSQIVQVAIPEERQTPKDLTQIIIWSSSEVIQVISTLSYWPELVKWSHTTTRGPRSENLLFVQKEKSWKCLIHRPLITTCSKINPKLTQTP